MSFTLENINMLELKYMFYIIQNEFCSDFKVYFKVYFIVIKQLFSGSGSVEYNFKKTKNIFRFPLLSIFVTGYLFVLVA